MSNSPRAHEDGVARPGAAGVDALGAGLGDGRLDDLDFLAAELAAFAGVRIQARDRHARPRDAHLATGPVGQAQRAQLGLGRDARDDVGQRHVDGHQQHAQLVIGQHHGEVRRAGAFGQDLGMAGIVDAGQVHGMLVQWRGDDGADGARLGVVDGGADVVVGAASGLGAELPRRQVGGQGGTAADDLDQAGAQAGLGRRGNLDHVQARAQRGARGAARRRRRTPHAARAGPAHRLGRRFQGRCRRHRHGDAHGQLGVHDMRRKGFAWANATPGSAGGLLLRLPVAVVLGLDGGAFEGHGRAFGRQAGGAVGCDLGLDQLAVDRLAVFIGALQGLVLQLDPGQPARPRCW